MSWRSAIYTGRLVHSRRDEHADHFDYPICFFGFDLEELEGLDRGLRLFGHQRRGLFSLRDADYADGANGLRSAAVEFARGGGVTRDIARVELITQPRVAGYVFNPVSFYLCRDAEDELVCAIAEINNTYGGRHRYLLSEANRRSDGRYHTDKVFYVSPYIHRASAYAWTLSVHGDHRTVTADVLDARGERFFRATLHGRRRELSDRSLARTAIRYPMMTVQIIGLIHWHAYLLRRRGVQHQDPPARDRAP